MVPFIYLPREHHSVRTLEEYLAKHRQFVERRAAGGARFQVHPSTAPIAARVDANSWIVDCVCGAGNATDPAWGVACCYGCGAIHTTVQFPEAGELAAIEAVLTARVDVADRAWRPGETVVDLIRENLDIAAGVPAPVVAFLVEDRL